MKKILSCTAIALAGLTSVFADATFTLKAMPWVYDPGKTGIASAKWVDKEGLADNDVDLANGKPGKALVLKKLGATNANAASGASIYGVAWINFKELGFDLRNDGHQGAGSPRFNVVTADGGFHFSAQPELHPKQLLQMHRDEAGLVFDSPAQTAFRHSIQIALLFRSTWSWTKELTPARTLPVRLRSTTSRSMVRRSKRTKLNRL